jgi:hypothetical protein
MMPDLFLHIGTEKTGSTAIQRFLANHSDPLAQLGIHVPQCLGHAEHWRFPLLFYADDQYDDLTERAGFQQLSLTQRQAAIRELQLAFDHELNGTSACTWVISSEHIHSRLLHRNAGMEALVGFLRERFDRVNVIVYLREPLDAALSLWSTAVRNGACLLELPLPKSGYWQHLCDHRSTVQCLEHWFPGQFLLRLYIPSEWPDRDVVGDFIDALGLPRSLLQPAVPSRVNRSLSWLSLHLLARLNRRSKPSHALVAAIRDAFDHYPPPCATREQELGYSAAFRESNDWVCTHYFPGRSQLFTLDGSHRDG